MNRNKENERLQIRNNRRRVIRYYNKEKESGTLTPERERTYINWLIKNTQASRRLDGLKTGEEKDLGKGGRAKFMKTFEKQAKKDLGIEE